MFSRVYSILAFAAVASQVVLAIPTGALHNPLEARTTFFTGTATWFWQEGAAGACGQVHKDTDHIVALSEAHYKNGHCGDTITIKDNKTGKSATATVADLCPGCGTEDIDLSHGLFTVFAPDTDGVFPVTWHFGN